MRINFIGRITPETPDEICAYGRMTAELAISPLWPSPLRRFGAVVSADLFDAVETFELIRASQIHPVSEYPDLAGDPEDAHKALERGAEAIRDLTAELLRVFPGCEVFDESGVVAA